MRKFLAIITIFLGLSVSLQADQRLIITSHDTDNQLNYSDTSIARASFSEPGVCLALSGGGARGLAQIGVLEVLEENNIPIKFIAGTSMGAIVGGLYCSGYSAKELHELVLDIDWRELFSSTPIRSSLLTSAKGRSEKALLKIGLEKWRPAIPRGITAGQKLSNLLTRLCYRAGVRSTISFDFLNPPFRATATDLVSGKLEVISSGDLAEAMRASMSFPVGFTPVATGDKLYVDGGLVNPVPVELCRSIAGGPVIAVNTTSPLLPVDEISDAIDMANQSTTVMSLNNLNQQLSEAEIVIEPGLGYHKSFDFDNIKELIDSGRQATLELLPFIRQSLHTEIPVSHKEFKIVETRIAGLKSLPESYFMAALNDSSYLSRHDIEENLRAIEKTGFVNSAHAELIPATSSYNLVYVVDDNPRIKGFAFSGMTVISPQTLLKQMKSEVGQIANYNTLLADSKNIERLYANSGYTLARVLQLRVDSKTGIVSIAIDEGRIDNISVKGNERTKNWVVFRDMKLHENELFTARKAQQSLDNLYATGLFETVKLTAQPETPGVDINVKVEEKSFDYLRAGARYDNEYKAAGFVDLVASNIVGTGNEAYLSCQLGERKRAYQLTMKSDRIFRTYLTYRLSLNHSLFKRNHYIDHESAGYLSEMSTGIDFEIGQHFARLGKLSAVFGLYRHIYDTPGQSRSTDRRQVSIAIRSLVDTFNSLPIPEKGKLHQFELEFARDILGGEMLYTKFYTSIEAYYPLVHGLNFHPRAELGFFNTTPPYFKQFSLGGRNSFYGLFSDEYLGAKILDGSFELRQKLTDYLYITGRYDLGKVWNKLESIRFDELEHAIGGSLIFKTMIGPVGLAYGRTSDGLDAFYFYAGYDY